MTRDHVAALQDTFWRKAEHLLLYHTNPWELDEALCEWGYAVGPCEAMDLAGLDAVLARVPDRSNPVPRRMVAEGRLGKKGGVGFYRYPGGGGAVIDPLIEDLIREEAWFARIERVEVSNETLVAALNVCLVERLQYLETEKKSWGKVLQAAVHFPVGKYL